MRSTSRAITRGVTALAALALVCVPSSTVGAVGHPRAEFSIDPGAGGLSVLFVARSSGFSAPVLEYRWRFGDGSRVTTSRPVVSHRYARPATFGVVLTEVANQAETATADGTIALFRCPAGTGTCSDTLRPAGAIESLTASGPVASSARAELDLFVGPFRIPSCQLEVVPTGAVTDQGFIGNVTITISYTSSYPNQDTTTCFASTVAFVDNRGTLARTGALPACQASGPKPPCVQSVSINSRHVRKAILVPPGDPRIGAP